MKLTSEDKRRIIENLDLFNDAYMSKFFDGQIDCTEILVRTILSKDDLVVKSVRSQVYEGSVREKYIRLDILATDSEGKLYNIEVQRSDEGARFKRARLYASFIDANTLKKGENFDDLSELYVIFITENDVIGKNKAVYNIERCIKQTGDFIDDGLHIVYVNGAFEGDEPIAKLMADFRTHDINEMQNPTFKRRATFFKEALEGGNMNAVLKEYENKWISEGYASGVAWQKAQSDKKITELQAQLAEMRAKQK